MRDTGCARWYLFFVHLEQYRVRRAHCVSQFLVATPFHIGLVFHRYLAQLWTHPPHQPAITSRVIWRVGTCTGVAIQPNGPCIVHLGSALSFEITAFEFEHLKCSTSWIKIVVSTARSVLDYTSSTVRHKGQESPIHRS